RPAATVAAALAAAARRDTQERSQTRCQSHAAKHLNPSHGATPGRKYFVKPITESIRPGLGMQGSTDSKFLFFLGLRSFHGRRCHVELCREFREQRPGPIGNRDPFRATLYTAETFGVAWKCDGRNSFGTRRLAYVARQVAGFHQEVRDAAEVL